MRLQDQVAIITGAAGAGIGQTTARHFAQKGAHIVVVTRIRAAPMRWRRLLRLSMA